MIDRFYSDVGMLELRFPVAEISRRTGFKKGQVSTYLKKKEQPSQNFLKAFYDSFKESLEKVQKPPLNDSGGHYGANSDYSDKVIALLERENERLRIDLEAMKEAVLLSLKGLSQSERLIRAMLKASLQLDVERDAKGNQKKLEALRRKVSSMINTNYKGRQSVGKKDDSKQMVNELP